MAKKINEECKIVQEILINEKSGGLLSSEESRISKHVYACQLCWEFQERLIYLSDAMRVDEKSHLEPRKTTRHVLISRFRQRHRKPGFQYLKVMDKIKRLFSYRIPLYQAMLATAVVTFFILLLSQSYFQRGVRDHQGALSAAYDSVNVGIMDVRINLNFVDEKKTGRNLVEDSSLTRYINISL